MQMTELPILYFHADDYGMTAHGDALIRDCQTHGCLNSVSIVPNGSLEEAVAALRPSGLKLAVHLNLVEGKALSPAAEIPLLVRPDGSFCNSFTGLLRLSLTPRRRAFAAQLYRELERQLLAYAALFPAGTPLRIDSHQHTHMIPLVFRTLLHILADHHLPVEHLRIPAEPLSPFVGCPRLWGSYSAVNAVKQLLVRYGAECCNCENLCLTSCKHTRTVNSGTYVYFRSERTNVVHSSAVNTLLLIE